MERSVLIKGEKPGALRADHAVLKTKAPKTQTPRQGAGALQGVGTGQSSSSKVTSMLTLNS